MLLELYPKVHRRYTSLPILGPILDGFGTWLLKQGYATDCVREHFCTARRITRILEERGIRSLKRLTRARLRACAPAFFGTSRSSGAIPPPPATCGSRRFTRSFGTVRQSILSASSTVSASWPCPSSARARVRLSTWSSLRSKLCWRRSTGPRPMAAAITRSWRACSTLARGSKRSSRSGSGTSAWSPLRTFVSSGRHRGKVLHASARGPCRRWRAAPVAGLVCVKF
jgi:hypothetical protein